MMRVYILAISLFLSFSSYGQFCCCSNDSDNSQSGNNNCIPDCNTVTQRSCDDGNDCTTDDIESISCDGSICEPCAGDPTMYKFMVCNYLNDCDGNNPPYQLIENPDWTDIGSGCWVNESSNPWIFTSSIVTDGQADYLTDWQSPNGGSITAINGSAGHRYQHNGNCADTTIVNAYWGVTDVCINGLFVVANGNCNLSGSNSEEGINGISLQSVSAGGQVIDNFFTGALPSSEWSTNPQHSLTGHDGFYRVCFDCVGDVFLAYVAHTGTPGEITGCDRFVNIADTCYNQGDELSDYDNTGENNTSNPNHCDGINTTTPTITINSTTPKIIYDYIFAYEQNL